MIPEKTTFSIEPEIMHIVHQIANEEGCTQEDVIREALKNYIQHISRPKPKDIGRYEELNARDLEIINQRAEYLNQEADDVLKYQVRI